MNQVHKAVSNNMSTRLISDKNP